MLHSITVSLASNRVMIVSVLPISSLIILDDSGCRGMISNLFEVSTKLIY